MQTILIRKSEMHLIRLINLLICSYYLLVSIELNMSNNCRKFMRAFVIKFNSRSLNELPPPKLLSSCSFKFFEQVSFLPSTSSHVYKFYTKRSMFFFLHDIYSVKNLRKRSLLFLYFFFIKP